MLVLMREDDVALGPVAMVHPSWFCMWRLLQAGKHLQGSKFLSDLSAHSPRLKKKIFKLFLECAATLTYRPGQIGDMQINIQKILCAHMMAGVIDQYQ